MKESKNKRGDQGGPERDRKTKAKRTPIWSLDNFDAAINMELASEQRMQERDTEEKIHRATVCRLAWTDSGVE